jgi:hypothetical protein
MVVSISRGEIGRRHNGKSSFCQCPYCCNQCKGTTLVRLTRLHDDGVPYRPLQEIIVYCPYCFGTGRKLTSSEYLEFARKQREEEEDKERIQQQYKIDYNILKNYKLHFMVQRRFLIDLPYIIYLL